MFTKRSTRVTVMLLGALVAALAILVALAPEALGQEVGAARERNIAVEIAENGTRFVPDETPADEEGHPAYGTEFITEGYIYPAGTLTCVDNECNGVLDDGSPEFPDLVLGQWHCFGWHVGEGAQTTTGPWVVSTQIFDFGDTPGAMTVVTQGYEYSDFNVAFLRAITGGTGQHRNAGGEQTQEFLGWNPSLGAALRVVLSLNVR